MTDIDTHGVRLEFGRHRGELLTRVPVSYLKWMLNAKHSQANLAQAELKRRGTVTPDLEVSGHAIDRASLLCRSFWHHDRRDDEGLHAWLVRVSGEALKSGEKINEKIAWKGMKFKFVADGIWPVLLTVMPGTQKQQRRFYNGQ